MSNYNRIILGDCIEVMRQLPTESVQMAFADPPFNLKKKYNSYKDKKLINEYLDWCFGWIDEMVRILHPTGSLFVHNIPKWLTYYATHLNKKMFFKHWIAWDAAGAPLGKTLLPNHYGILYYTKSQKEFKFFDVRYPHKKCRLCGAFHKDYGGKKDLMHPFGTLISDVWSDIHRIRHNNRRDEHPCQLPVPLLERLILMTTDKGDLVVDPFIGAGTSAVAAKRLGRKFIGIDLDAKYVEITKSNLEFEQETIMNDAHVSIFLGEVRSLRDIDYDKVKSKLPNLYVPPVVKHRRIPKEDELELKI